MRTLTRTSGSVTVTEMELRKRGYLQTFNYGSSAGLPLRKQTFDFINTDWTADGAMYYVDCDHGLRSRDVMYKIYDQNTSEEIMPERSNAAPSGDTDKLRVWLSYAPASCRIVVI